MRIVWASDTKEDFARLNDFLIPFNEDVARRAVNSIREGPKVLADFPDRGRPMNDGTGRRELFIRFGQRGYVLRYKADKDAGLVKILRVWHSLEDRE